MGKRVMLYVFTGLLVAWMLLIAFEWVSVYHPNRGITYTPEAVGLEYTDEFFFTQDDKKLHGWWIPHEEASAVILFCHGNAGNIGDRIYILQSLHALGYSVFVFDYRGYGLSRGIPHERGTQKDVLAAYEVIRTKNEKNLPVIAYGRSLGGAVAAQLAVRQPVDGLILESTFTSIPDMGQHFYPFLPKFLSRIQYNTLKKVQEIDYPILVAHGRNDGLIPFWMGETIRDAVPGKADWMDLKGSHNDHPFDSTHGYAQKFMEFVSKCASRRSNTVPQSYSQENP